MFHPLDVWSVGEPPRAEKFNREIAQLNKQRVVYVGEGLESFQALGGTSVSPVYVEPQNPTFWVQVSGVRGGAGVYSGIVIGANATAFDPEADPSAADLVSGTGDEEEIVIVNVNEIGLSGHMLWDAIGSAGTTGTQNSTYRANWAGMLSTDEPPLRVAMIESVAFTDCSGDDPVTNL